jgi:hypothetical protein
MLKPKAIILHAVLFGLCLTIGVFLGKRHAQCNYRRDSSSRTYGEMASRIRVANFIFENASDKAIQDLEQPLDSYVMLFGSVHHQPKLTQDERSVLWLIAQHRIAHPFKNSEHPEWDPTVQKALQGLK